MASIMALLPWALLLVLLGVLVLVGISLYNGLVQKRIRCQEAWSQINVQLKRRYDLIPNLVETVKGYATHEKTTLEDVIAARNAAVSAHGVTQQAAAENVLTGALRQLFAVVEAYPNLKANENFAQLQEQLAGTENQISFTRQFYNDSAAVYNTARETFPGVLVANLFHFEKQEYFQLAAPVEGEAPKVKF